MILGYSIDGVWYDNVGDVRSRIVMLRLKIHGTYNETLRAKWANEIKTLKEAIA